MLKRASFLEDRLTDLKKTPAIVHRRPSRTERDAFLKAARIAEIALHDQR
jgi:hypothetical protein